VKRKLTGLARELQEYKSGLGMWGEKRNGLWKELAQHRRRIIKKRQEWSHELYYRYGGNIILQLCRANYSMTRLDLFGEHAPTRVQLEEKVRDCVLDGCLDYVKEIDSGRARRWVREGQPRDVIIQKAEKGFKRWRKRWRRARLEDFLDFLSDMRRGIVNFGPLQMGSLESRQRFALKIINGGKKQRIITALEADTLHGLTVASGDYKALSHKTGVKEGTLRERVSSACRKIVPWIRHLLHLDSRGRQIEEADSNLDWLWEDSITGGYTSGITKLHGDEWAVDEGSGF